MHCSNLGADALKNAIENYKSKMEGRKEELISSNEKCECPFCHKDFDKQMHVCKFCKTKLCANCYNFVDKNLDICPKCGSKV